jgi:hypothetical protein
MATSEKRLVRTALEQKSKPPAAPTVIFGREICNDLAVAEREWLVTNGIGGFASGTVSGNLTRRYHGLLIAALNPLLDEHNWSPKSRKSSATMTPLMN